MPYQKKHIPFLITHLGLLMILAGVMVKSLFGVQGSMVLTEGTGSSKLLLQNTFALLAENRNQKFCIPLKQGKNSISLFHSGFKIRILEWLPHTEERLEGFIKGDLGHVLGLPPFPLTNLAEKKPYQTAHYDLYAIEGCALEEISFPGKASLFFHVDEKRNEKLIAFNEAGERFEQAIGNSFYIFDKGYGGYAVFADLPPHFPQLELMAPLTRFSQKLPKKKKLEENIPRILLLISDGTQSEMGWLTYDPTSSGFRWPFLQGKWLFRFQPQFKEIPFHVRLKQAREIRYPGTDKPYSFESDLTVDGEETTISMNHVFEKKGYRFYMANLAAPPRSAKRAMLVVNYDPAKRFLTYPGAILLAIGMILLYLRRLYA